MSELLMPMATAVWLVENTTLTFDQIADFCELHPLEVQGVADGELATGIIGQNPVMAGQLTREELMKALADSSYRLKICDTIPYEQLGISRKKGRYTPVARRQDKPDAISWLIKNHSNMTDSQIARLIGTTKKTIDSIRNKSHWNMNNIKPRDPILLGLCTQTDLTTMIARAAGNKSPLKAVG